MCCIHGHVFFKIIMRNNLYLNDGNFHLITHTETCVQQLFKDKQKLIFHSNSYILRPLALTLHENRETIIPIFKLITCSMIQLIIKLENIF